MIRRWLEARRIQRKIALIAAMARAAEQHECYASAACFREAEGLLYQELGSLYLCGRANSVDSNPRTP